MTVKQVVGEQLTVNGVAEGKELQDRLADLFEVEGLDAGMMERNPHAFSGGQPWEIVIARTIALEPRLVIADEPTSALDMSILTQALVLLFRPQAERGGTVLRHSEIGVLEREALDPRGVSRIWCL